MYFVLFVSHSFSVEGDSRGGKAIEGGGGRDRATRTLDFVVWLEDEIAFILLQTNGKRHRGIAAL